MEPDFDLTKPSIAYRAGELVEHLRDCGVVLVEWPDGDKWLVKGADRLRGIVATGEAELMRIGLIPVANTTQAEIVAAAVQLIESGEMTDIAKETFGRMLASTCDLEEIHYNS